MMTFGSFRLDQVNRCLWRRTGAGDDERILLTPTEFDVLVHLVERAGRLVTHRELLDAVWPSTAIEPQAVKSNIFRLRRVLVGRDAALAELRECLRSASGGRLQIVFVTGEPGIGKTALVEEFAREAAYPVLDAVGELCRGPDGPRLVDSLPLGALAAFVAWGRFARAPIAPRDPPRRTVEAT